MRSLVAIGLFREVEEGMYCHSKSSLAVKHPDFQTFVSGLYGFQRSRFDGRDC